MRTAIGSAAKRMRAMFSPSGDVTENATRLAAAYATKNQRIVRAWSTRQVNSPPSTQKVMIETSSKSENG